MAGRSPLQRRTVNTAWPIGGIPVWRNRIPPLSGGCASRESRSYKKYQTLLILSFISLESGGAPRIIGTIGARWDHWEEAQSMSLLAAHKTNVCGQTARLAIAGLGLVGLRHADALSAASPADLVAVVDPGETAASEARKRSVPHYATLAEMFASDRPDGVILSTPTRLHVEQAFECIEANVPVLVEKPLSDDLSAASVLVEAAKAADVVLLVGHHRRHNPLIRKARALIADGRVGEIRAVHATCWFYKPDSYFDTAPWRKLKGAGPISVNLVHDIDLLRHLCGEIVSVQAQAAPSIRRFENEDVAAAILQFENGAIGTITVSDSIVSPWSWELTAKEYPVYPATTQSAYMIGGSHGSLSIPDQCLWTYGGDRDWWAPISATSSPFETSDPLINQILHFVDVIAGRIKPLVSGEEGLKTLRVVDAIQRAAVTGNTVQLDVKCQRNVSP